MTSRDRRAAGIFTEFSVSAVRRDQYPVEFIFGVAINAAAYNSLAYTSNSRRFPEFSGLPLTPGYYRVVRQGRNH